MFPFFSAPVPIRLKTANLAHLAKSFKNVLTLSLFVCGIVCTSLFFISLQNAFDQFLRSDIRDSDNRMFSVVPSHKVRRSLLNNKIEAAYFPTERFESHPNVENGVNKILCYVLLSRRKFVAANVIKNTWGKHCDKLVFYGRFNNTDLPVTFINATEGYEYLWGKTKSALVHLEKEFSMTYDWFFKADDDTFVIMENLRSFIQEFKLNPAKPIWYGYKLRHKRMEQGYMSGGAGYVFSTSALSQVVRLLNTGETETFESNWTKRGSYQPTCDTNGIKGIEDLELGKCFLAAGVQDVSTVDLQSRERFLPLPLNSLLNGDISSFHWIWRQAWNPLRTGKKCCSSMLISLHQITPYEMNNLYFLIYKLQRG